MTRRQFNPLLLSVSLLTLLLAAPISMGQIIDIEDDLEEEKSLDELLLGKEKEKPKRVWEAGRYDDLLCESAREHKFSLFIPESCIAALKENPEARFPSLYLHNPSGRIKKDMNNYQAWAEKRGVILVGIPRIRNGLADHLKRQIQGHVLKSLDLMNVPVHPYLRFTIGMSGGSADGERMTRWHGGQDRFAGTIQMGVFRLHSDKNKGLAIVSLQGARDRFIKPVKLYEDLETAKQRGTPMKLVIDPDRAHKAAPLNLQVEMLDWIVGLMKLTHHKHDQKTRAFYLEHARTEMKTVAKIKARDTRMKESQRLLSYPVLQPTEEGKALLKQWTKDVEANVSAATNPVDQHLRLRHATRLDTFTLLSETKQTQWQNLITQLRKNKAVVHDWQAEQLYETALKADILAGLNKAQMYEAALLYQKLIDFDPTHPRSKAVKEKTEHWLSKYKPKP